MRYKSHIDASASTPSLETGLRAQLDDRSALLSAGAEHRGWKAGFGTATALANLGTDGPLVGFLTERTLLDSGASVDVSAWGKAVLESEVAVRLGTDVAADADADGAATAIEATAAAIELVDLGAAGTDPEAILAANVFHRHYLLGEFVPLADRKALDAVRIDVAEGDSAVATGADPRDVLGDLAEVVAALAGLLARGDESLRSGDVIITGAAVAPAVVSGGEHFDVEVGSSAVAVSIS